jgi:hypothetical protein
MKNYSLAGWASRRARLPKEGFSIADDSARARARVRLRRMKFR